MLLQDYDFYLADTEAAKQIHYHLRYQVYCLREKFEDPSAFPANLEQDVYDDQSIHFIARFRVTGEWLGAMRLVIAPAHDLPICKVAPVEPGPIPRTALKNAAEASRLCTLLPTRQRDKFSPGEATEIDNGVRRLVTNALHASWIAVGLIRAARRYCLEHKITHCFFLIGEPLARMLRRLGMEIEPVGSPCLHRGWRRPYIHNVRTGYRSMSARCPDLYKFFGHPAAYKLYSESEAVFRSDLEDRSARQATYLIPPLAGGLNL
jgi:N-acyl amino acid synthase of PEP-CTERM/exosortase system